jgi:hypothetical protein
MSSLLFVVALLFGRAPDSLDTAVVATVGRFTITGRDLLDSYEFGPAFVKRARDPLRKHLEYMIDERLIALEAERLRYDTTAFVRERVAALEEDLAVDQLYHDKILSNVTLSEEEVEAGIRKARTNLRLRWIYANTNQEAQNIAVELNRGVAYDSLYACQFHSSDSTTTRAMETTLLALERDNPDIASQLVHVRSQKVSTPLKGSDGYYIIRIDEVWQNPLATETEYVTLKDMAVKVVRMMKADNLAQEYVRGKMALANPIIKAEGYNIVRAYLADKGLSRDTRLKWKIPTTFMTEAGPQPIIASGKLLSRPLVTFGTQTLTVRDYLRWFDIRQFQLKTHSREAFNSSVKRTIWKIVQDGLLSQEAYELGLHLRDTVQHEMSKWEAKLLYLAGRTHLRRSITITELDLKKRFDEQKHRYIDASGKQLDFAEAKLYIWTDIYSEEETKVLFRTACRPSND